MVEVESTSNWLLHKLDFDTHENLTKISTVLWGIWFAGNKRIWGEKQFTPVLTIEGSTRQICKWKEAVKRFKISNAIIGNAEDILNKVDFSYSGTSLALCKCFYFS